MMADCGDAEIVATGQVVWPEAGNEERCELMFQS